MRIYIYIYIFVDVGHQSRRPPPTHPPTPSSQFPPPHLTPPPHTADGTAAPSTIGSTSSNLLPGLPLSGGKDGDGAGAGEGEVVIVHVELLGKPYNISVGGFVYF